MQPQPDSPPEALAPLDTRVRFSLRGIFIATAVVAAWLAAVTPWFREWDGEQRLAFLLIWGSTMLGAIVTVVVLRSRRTHAERSAGQVRFRLPVMNTRLALFCGLGVGLFVLVLSTGLGFYQAINPSSREFGGIWTWNFMALENGAILALAGLGTWWRTTNLEFCDEGIVTGFGMLPWKKMRGFLWGGSDPNLLVLQCPWTVVTVRVHAGDKRAIEQFLGQRLAANSRPHE
ncbi:MAG TPA: hypothetical protein VHB99_07075 [Pirellulales bacterium]|nr:hypothetical protein [Pirellulales bacterium]